MNAIIQNFLNLKVIHMLPYFLPEIICTLGVFLNLLISPFVLYKQKLKTLSNLLTSIVFTINSAILIFILIYGKVFSIGKDIIIYNNSAIMLKFFLNLFALIYILTTYKYTKTAQFRLPLVNSTLILIIMLSGLLASSDNFAFIYVLLEIIIILIYKYASNLRFKKNGLFSSAYIAISFCATVLFIAFYVSDYFVVQLIQKSIIQSCMILAILLKIGLFPIYNYSMDKKCRSNISYCILLFCLLPFVGAIAFSKLISLCMFNEICQLCTMAFIMLCAFFASVSLFKIKNLTGYLINLVQIYTCFYILDATYTKDLNFYFICIVSGLFLIMYSMLRKYKNNRKNMLIFSLLLLLSAFLIPLSGFGMIFNIYTFDKIGFYALNLFICCNILIIIKTLNIIESFYKIKSKN